jgi:aminoglycoside phosphotransferase family enzyme
MSFILLTDTYVYKVKKPVNLGYLDYTTLEKRKHFCQQEIVLNRRLCSSAYLGVVSINRDKGSYHISEQDEGIEYAVKMRRLPQEAMMDVFSMRRLSSSVLSIGWELRRRRTDVGKYTNSRRRNSSLYLRRHPQNML